MTPLLRSLLQRLKASRRGQSMVELALALPLLIALVVGIAEFGLLFSTYVQVSNAAREGARAGSRYVYDFTGGANERALNDQMRGWGTGIGGYNWYGRTSVVNAVKQELSGLPAAGFNQGTYAAPVDLLITYPDTAGTFSSGPRWMDHITVRVTYHYTMPLISSLVPVPLTVDLQSRTTMAIQDR